MKKTTGLGRGLDALIDTSHVVTGKASRISEIPLSEIVDLTAQWSWDMARMIRSALTHHLEQ